MKTISLTEAIALLIAAKAVIIDDCIGSHSVSEYSSDDPDSEFLYIGWDDGEGLEFEVKFACGPNNNVTVNGSDMTLIDTEGEAATFTLLAPMAL